MRTRASARLPLACLMTTVLAGGAMAQSYPAKVVRLVVPFPAGGGTDVLARVIAQGLSARIGQPVIVDNRGAVPGIVGTEHVARSLPDGHTVLFTTSVFATLPALQSKLPYDPQRDFAPVGRLTTVPYVLVTHPALPVRSAKDLVALARQRPDEINFASQGPGSASHLSAELFKKHTGVRMTHVPYKGAGQAVTALLSGEVSVLITVPIVAQAQIRTGRIRLLAVTSGERSKQYPEIPTLRESGVKDFEALQWHGVWLPAATPTTIVDRLNAELNAVAASPSVAERMRGEGAEPVSTTPRAFADFVTQEIRKWGEIIRAAGLKFD